MKKIFYTMWLLGMIFLKLNAQTPGGGFDQDVVIKNNIIRKKIKDYEDNFNKVNPRNKIELDYPLEMGKEFKISLWDKGSSFTQQSYSLNDIDMSSYELLSTNLSFSDKDQVQKIIVLPFKVSENENIRKWLGTFKVNVALKGGISTFGAGIGGDNSDAFSRRGKRILFNYQKNDKTPRVPKDNESFEEYEKNVLIPYKSHLDSMLVKYNEERMRRVFKWTIGYNVQLFSVLSSKGDVAGFDTLNIHTVKSENYSGAFTYSIINGEVILGAGINYANARKSAAKSQERIDYWTQSASLSFRLFNLMRKEELERSEEYKKIMLQPAIHGGVSYEYTEAKGDFIYYIDGIKSTKTISPFIDIIISSALQFRISVPIIRNEYVDAGSKTVLGANLQYNFKLSNLGK